MLLCITVYSFRKYDRISIQLSQPDLTPSELTQLGKSYASLGGIVELIDQRQEVIDNIDGLVELGSEIDR